MTEHFEGIAFISVAATDSDGLEGEDTFMLQVGQRWMPAEGPLHESAETKSYSIHPQEAMVATSPCLRWAFKSPHPRDGTIGRIRCRRLDGRNGS